MNRIVPAVFAPVCACALIGVLSAATPQTRVPVGASPVAQGAAPKVEATSPEFTRALTSNIATPEALAAAAAVAHRGGVIPCHELTMSFALEPVSGLTAVIRLRGTDLDGDGSIRADAGGYDYYTGPDEVEECTATIYRNGVVETVITPVVDSVFVDAVFFYFNWVLGSGTVLEWDTGAQFGVFIAGGSGLVQPDTGVYVNPNPSESATFPSYELAAVPCACPELVCHPGAIDAEFEPDCGLPLDTVNGGCNSTPFLATPIQLDQYVCGTGAYDGNARDTDFYELTLATTTRVIIAGAASFEMQMALLPANHCTTGADLGFVNAGPCEQGRITAVVPAGTYYVFAAADFLTLQPCGSRYSFLVAKGCLGDINDDGATNASDFNILASHFRQSVPPGTQGDLNRDGVVNASDFNILAGDFRCVQDMTRSGLSVGN